jgi:hypothetical protein
MIQGILKKRKGWFRYRYDLFGWFLSPTWLCEPGSLEPGSGDATNLLVSGEPGPRCFKDRASLDPNLMQATKHRARTCIAWLTATKQQLPASSDASTRRCRQQTHSFVTFISIPHSRNARRAAKKRTPASVLVDGRNHSCLHACMSISYVAEESTASRDFSMTQSHKCKSWDCIA